MIAEPRKAGRPRGGQFVGTVPVSVRMSDDMYAELYAIARVLQKDVAVVIREAIAQKIVSERRQTARAIVVVP